MNIVNKMPEQQLRIHAAIKHMRIIQLPAVAIYS